MRCDAVQTPPCEPTKNDLQDLTFLASIMGVGCACEPGNKLLMCARNVVDHISLL